MTEHQPTDMVLLKRAAVITGYTISAMEHKIARGIWVEGREWFKAPDGKRMISMRGYERWAKGETA